MPEYLSPGLFIEERAAGPAVIQGVSTSNYGTCAWFPRGPVGVATLVTSFDEAVEKFFGDGLAWTWQNTYAAFALAAAFSNGLSRAYLVREVPTDAAKASATLEGEGRAATFVGRPHTGTVALTVANYLIKIQVDAFVATAVDITGNMGAGLTYTLEQLRTATNAALAIVDPSLSSVVSIVTTSNGRRLAFTSPTKTVTSKIEFTAPVGTPATYKALGLADVGTFTYLGVTATSRFTFDAYSEGTWGNRVRVAIQGDENYAVQKTTVPVVLGGGWTKFSVYVQEESTDGAGDWNTVEQYNAVDLDTNTDPAFIEEMINASSQRIVVTEIAAGIPVGLTPANVTGEWVNQHDGVATSFTGILYHTPIVRGSVTATDGVQTFNDNGDGTLSPTAGVGSGTINYYTGAISLTFAAFAALDTAIRSTYRRVSLDAQSLTELSGGVEGTSVNFGRSQVTDPTLQATSRGIYAMDNIEDVINVSMPDFAGSVSVIQDLVSWAEARKDRFIIVDPPISMTPQEVLDWKRFTLNPNTSYAALYWPWIKAPDAATNGLTKEVPPSGHMAGVFARTDQEANVGTAPAGVNRGRLNFCQGLAYDTSKGERDILNPANINVLVDTPQTGRAVWGARSLSLDSAWRYLQVRRLFQFVQKSVYVSTHWAVFENNNPLLWARIRLSLNGFLLNLHNDGYFAGGTPDQSYRVICDASNNPQSAIDAGLVTCDVYLAANKPGEFIRFRFQQIINQQG